MKINAIIRIITFSLAILLLSFILMSTIDQNYYLEDGKIHSYDDFEMVEPLASLQEDQFPSEVHNIEIEWAAGSITITEDASVQNIHIAEYSPAQSEHRTVMKQSGQTLKIKYSEESVKFSSFGTDIDFRKDLEIIVPAGWSCNSIEIDAAAADVEIHNLQINELDFDGASGFLVLDNCEIVNLDIDTASGDVEFIGTLKDLDFDAASAKFYGEFFQMPNHLNLDAMSGDVELVLPEYCWFTCELDTMSGSFDTDFATTQENGIYVHGGKTNACHIKVSAMSGNVSILKGVDVPATAGKNCDH